jgi:hypothetical protein
LDIYTPATEWSRWKVLLIYSLPSFYAVSLIVIFYQLYLVFKRSNKLIKLYLLWGYVFSIALFFGGLMFGMFKYKGLAVIFAWLGLPPFLNYGFGIFALIGLGIWGGFLNAFFLKMAPSQSFRVHQFPRFFLWQVAILPYFMMLGVLLPLFTDSFTIPAVVLMFSTLVSLLLVFISVSENPKALVLVKGFRIDQFSISSVLLATFAIWAVKVLRYFRIDF